MRFIVSFGVSNLGGLLRVLFMVQTVSGAATPFSIYVLIVDTLFLQYVISYTFHPCTNSGLHEIASNHLFKAFGFSFMA